MDFLKLSKRDHFLGSRLKVVGVDFEKNPESLANFINGSKIKQKFKNQSKISNFYKESAELIYPDFDVNCGLCIRLIKENTTTEVSSLVPFFKDIGLTYEGEIYEVNIWEGGTEAQIYFGLNINEVTFYDNNFLENRKFYIPNSKFKARIYGVAYRADFLKDEKVEIKITEEMAEVFKKDVGEITTLHTDKMSSFLPLDDSGGDIDEYEVSGKISAIRKIKLNFCNKKAYVCRIDCMREIDEYYEFEILIIKENWNEENEPKIGDYIHLICFFAGEIII